VGKFKDRGQARPRTKLEPKLLWVEWKSGVEVHKGVSITYLRPGP
jgi:hypothetical protein